MILRHSRAIKVLALTVAVLLFSNVLAQPLQATPITAPPPNTDCEFLCIGIIVGAVVIVGVLGYKAIDEMGRTQRLQLKQQFRERVFEKAIAAGVVTKENAADIIKTVGDITNDSALNSTIDTKVAGDKAVQLKALLNSRDRIDGIDLFTDHLSQISPAIAGSEVSAYATTSRNVLSTVSATSTSTDVPLSQAEFDEFLAIKNNALRRVDTNLGTTSHTFISTLDVSQLMIDFNTDLDLPGGLSGTVDLAYQVEITDPRSTSPLIINLFSGGATYTSQNGLSVTGDLQAFLSNAPPSPIGTYTAPFLFPVVIDNVSANSSYKLTMTQNVVTWAAVIPEPATAWPAAAALAALAALGYRRARLRRG